MGVERSRRCPGLCQALTPSAALLPNLDVFAPACPGCARSCVSSAAKLAARLYRFCSITLLRKTQEPRRNQFRFGDVATGERFANRTAKSGRAPETCATAKACWLSLHAGMAKPR